MFLTSSLVARYMAVAAPSEGVRKNGFNNPVIVFPNPVFLSIPMFVATAPGWQQFTVILLFFSLLASSLVNNTFASLLWE